MALPENRRIPCLDLGKHTMEVTVCNSMTRNLLKEKYGVFVTGKEYENIRAKLVSEKRHGQTEDELSYEFGHKFKSKHKNNIFQVIVEGGNKIRSVVV